jgi:hypothetical protein
MIFVEIGRLWHWCASLQPQETKPHETESRLAFLTESILTLQVIEPSEAVKFLAGPMHGWHVYLMIFVETGRLWHWCASLQLQEAKPHETESRLTFLTESILTLQVIEPSETVKFLAGPMHGWHVYLMIFVETGRLWHWCASLQLQEAKPHETESRLAFLTESI